MARGAVATINVCLDPFCLYDGIFLACVGFQAAIYRLRTLLQETDLAKENGQLHDPRKYSDTNALRFGVITRRHMEANASPA